MHAENRRIALLFLRWIAVTRHRLIVDGLIWFSAVWLICALAVFLFEGGHNPRIHSLADAIYGLLVTMTTSGDSAVAPVTSAGRWVLSVAVLASKLLTALLCALAAAVLIERRVREDMGLKMFNYRQHLVIIGWNMKGPHILRALQHDPVLGTKPVVVMSEGDGKPLEDPDVHWTRSSLPIRGESVERAGLARASHIIVLANYAEKSHADALTAINCLMARKLNAQAQITAELLDPSQRAYLEAAGVDNIVGIGEVGGFMLAEAAVGNEETRAFLARLSGRARELGSPGSTGPSESRESPGPTQAPDRARTTA